MILAGFENNKMVNGGRASRELFFFNIVGVYVSLVHSYFNAEEIYGVTYGFEISSEPVLLKESPDLGNTLLLSSKHGQQYQCILPQLENLEKKNEENHHITKDEIPQLLEPMKKKCLYNNKGWWTYEVCFGKGIYQYHKEGQEVVGDKITLGVFSNETDWSQEKIHKKEKPKPGKSNVVKRFHSQYYVNGSECDLTGKARETQIKIYCDEGIADVVLRVDEPSSCSYVVTVHTNKLCRHSLFRPNPSQKLQAITCSPALSEERYKIYVERIESRKRAKEEAEAAKYQAEKARAAKKIEREDELIEPDEEEGSTKKKRSKRSQVWPWENPGVESEDEVWIDGNIKPDEIGVHRLDITKGRKKNADGFQESEGITIMSQKMQRKRDPQEQRQKGETDGNLEEMSEREDGQEQTEQAEKTVETENIEEAGNKQEDEVVTGQNNEQESKEKQATSEEDETEKATESSGTPNGASEKIEKETSESEKGLDEEWRTKMEEAVLKLRSTLKEKLVKLGIKPEVLDQKFKEKLGSVVGKGSEKDYTESHTGTDDEQVDKLEERDTNVPPKTGQPEQTNKDPFARTIEEMKILNEGMMKELMDAALATQAELEKQFDEERAQMKTAVEHVKTKIKEIEEIEEKNGGVKDGPLGETMSKIRNSIERFEKTNMQLDEDMLSVKELNKEIFRSIEDKENTDAQGDLLQLSSKTNKLVKKILLRRFQLEQDLHYIKKMQSKISADEENTRSTDNTEFSANKGGIDQVVNKLKTMIQDLDNTEARPEAGAATAAEDKVNSIEPGSSSAATAEDVDSAGLFDQGDMRTGVKVKVSKIKKVTIPDDDESELEETDLDEEEMEELNMDKRIRLATKKMEEMVKQELRDSGVVPSGKIRVKIVTSKDALESLDSKSDVRLLSDKEETQFRDMILGLLGGSPEAGKERKRQQDLENNYNLVWSDDELQTVPREDDDTDGEVEVESFR